MPRRRSNAAVSDQIINVEQLPIDDLEESTVEDYKKLNDKLDGCMTKIKSRKESKRKT